MSKTKSILFFVVVSLSFAFNAASGHALDQSENGELLRVRRQSKKREDTPINHDRIDQTLYGWEPRQSQRCAGGKYLCRDGSYCFGRDSLCNNLVSCDDQSDEINAFCGYTTTRNPNIITSVQDDGSDKNDDANSKEEENFFGTANANDRFNDPLVTGFIVVVVATLVYVAIGTVCFIKARFNMIRPQGPSINPTGNGTSACGADQTKQNTYNEKNEPTGDRVFVETETNN